MDDQTAAQQDDPLANPHNIPNNAFGLFVWWRELVEHHLHELTHLELKVLLVLMKHADNATRECFPGITRICDLVGCKTKSRVRRAIRSLERKEMIQTIDPGGGRRSARRRLILRRVYGKIDPPPAFGVPGEILE